MLLSISLSFFLCSREQILLSSSYPRNEGIFYLNVNHGEEEIEEDSHSASGKLCFFNPHRKQHGKS
jgi:hypothetical protein